MTWDWTFALAFNVAGAVVIAAFGVLVALVRPRTPQATVVAVFSIAYGLDRGLLNLALAAGTATAEAQVLGWVAGVAVLAGTVALFAMWWVLPVPGRPRGVPLVVALVSTGVAAAILAIPVLVGDALGSPLLGPAHLRFYFGSAALQVGAWWGLILLLASRLLAEPVALRGQTALLAGALALYPSHNTRFLFGADAWFALFSWVTVVFVVVAAAAWLWAGQRAGQPRAGRNVAWIILGVALLGMVTGRSGGEIASGVGLAGVARIATVAVLAYAVVRHHALGIDAKVRFAVSKSTVAAAFIAVFFIASEVAQQFFGETLESTYLGIAAAGALVFAMAPLQRVAERFAHKAVPMAGSAMASQTSSTRREEVYVKALRIALRDKRLTRAEETELHELAEELGISGARAHDLLAQTEKEA